MRIVVALLVSAALLAALPTPAPAGRRPAYEPKARRCERLTRRLEHYEEKQAARCGMAEGCTAASIRRHMRVAEKFASSCVRLNQIQAVGSHNSYHVQPMEPLWSALLAASSAFLPWEYSHLPLDLQFEQQGVRQIELDVYADPDGGLYRERLGLALIGGSSTFGPPILDEPGFKVFHVQDIDFESTCLTLVACLDTVRFWSDTHPDHLPLAILIELKDDDIPPLTPPAPIGPAELDALDAEIRSVFPPQHMITPDDVRGDFATLEEAVLTRGWPTLGWARGKVLFLMDNGGGERADYRLGHPSLEGRVLFTNSTPGQPDAAFVKQNSPTTTSPAPIPDVVAAGYLVRTRADADLVEGRTNDTSSRDAAIASGAHWVSTDFPEPRPELGSDYSVQVPGGMPARCNPVNAPSACRASALEP